MSIFSAEFACHVYGREAITIVSNPAGPVCIAAKKGCSIFTWPKVIFLYPTAIVALICWAGCG